MDNSVFSGRIMFDHLMKTGGTSIAGWLRETLGTGCVTPHVWGNHRDLLRKYGGLYSIISGHVTFENNEELDPRYHYMTCLREPIDRALSWIFFVLNDAPNNPNTSGLLRGMVPRFLDSDGKYCPRELRVTISNIYVRHFCRIENHDSVDDEQKFANAMNAIRRYDVLGFYENYTGFTKGVSNLVNIKNPSPVKKLNITTKRLRVDSISSSVRDILLELNQMDMRFYLESFELEDSRINRITPEPGVNDMVTWRKFDRRPMAVSSTVGSLSVISAISSMIAGGSSDISVNITNNSQEKWAGDPYRPISASYHWVNARGVTKVLDGHRTRLPEEGIVAGGTLRIDVRVLAPTEPGKYKLILTVVQERVCWFENKSFVPATLEIEVAK